MSPRSQEFHSALRHNARGVLAMANSGSNTNASQFYITFDAAPHLDNVHSVFGRVVGGSEVLDAIEKVDTIKGKNESRPKDAPRKDIFITAVTVYTNPFKDSFTPVDELTRKAANEVVAEEPEHEMGKWFSDPTASALPKQGADDKFKYLALPKPVQVDAAGVNIAGGVGKKAKRKESPNDAGIEAEAGASASAVHPAKRVASAANTPSAPMDTSQTPRATEQPEDDDAREFEAARRRLAAQQQATKTQSSYGNFGNW
jgi:peptidyl-prolyl cis-trans isomerase-like protein 2